MQNLADLVGAAVRLATASRGTVQVDLGEDRRAFDDLVTGGAGVTRWVHEGARIVETASLSVDVLAEDGSIDHGAVVFEAHRPARPATEAELRRINASRDRILALGPERPAS